MQKFRLLIGVLFSLSYLNSVATFYLPSHGYSLVGSRSICIEDSLAIESCQESFLDRYYETLKVFLSTVLPQGYDFSFKSQNSVTTYQQLFYLVSEGMFEQTGAKSLLEKVMRIHGSLQLLYLTEHSLAYRHNYAVKEWSEAILNKIANDFIKMEFIDGGYPKVSVGSESQTIYELFLKFIEATENQTIRSDFLSEDSLEKLGKAFERALKRSVERILARKAKKLGISLVRMKNRFNRLEKNFDKIPQQILEKKLEKFQLRCEQLIKREAKKKSKP